MIKQKFNQWFDKEDKSKLPLGVAEQEAREKRKQRSYKALRRERACPTSLSLRALAGGAGIACREEGGAPSLGRLSSLDPPITLTFFHPLTPGLGGGLGSGEEGCLGEGCLCDRDPDPRGWESPNHELLPPSDPVWRASHSRMG